MKPAFNWPVVTFHRIYCFSCAKDRMHEAAHGWQKCLVCAKESIIDGKTLQLIQTSSIQDIIEKY
jgi:hypothetical protein